MRQALLVAVVAVAVVALVGESRGDLWLYLEAGGQSYTIQDNSAFDADPAVDTISLPFMTSVGDFELDPGFSAYAHPNHLNIDFSATYLPRSSGFIGNTFTVKASYTDLFLPAGPVALGGFMGGTSIPAIAAENIAYQVNLDPGNTNSVLGIPGGFTLGPVKVPSSLSSFYNQDIPTAIVPGSGTFSLNYFATITADQDGQSTTFYSGAKANTIPEPASLGVWALAAGIGACVVGYRRTRGKAAQ